METRDLILRNWQDSDAKALYEIQCWKNGRGFKVIADKRNDNFIGFIIRKRRVENIARQHCNEIYLDV